MLTVDDYQIDTEEGTEPRLSIETQFALVRQKRSFSMERAGDDSAVDDSDSAATNKKCCRDDMKVNLRELKGFEFIVEPKEFNALMCRGRCPRRYHPLTEHSLLQSVMHMKHSEKGKIRKPCCVPSSLSSLPVLHLDDHNPAKLKVTTWKSVVVTQCA